MQFEHNMDFVFAYVQFPLQETQVNAENYTQVHETRRDTQNVHMYIKIPSSHLCAPGVISHTRSHLAFNSGLHPCQRTHSIPGH